MNTKLIYEGGCLCGSVRYKATSAPSWVTHCHCQMCRRHTGAVFATDAGFSVDEFTWLKGDPTYYRSTEACERGFCSRCGSTLCARYLEDMETIVVAVGTLDDAGGVQPEHHMMTESQLPWLKIDDGLPRYSRFDPENEQFDQGL